MAKKTKNQTKQTKIHQESRCDYGNKEELVEDSGKTESIEVLVEDQLNNTEIEINESRPDLGQPVEEITKSPITTINSEDDEKDNIRCKSWVNLFSQNRSKTLEAELHFIPPAVKDGARIVRFQSPEVSKWKNALLMTVFGENPKFFRFQNFAMNRWKTLGLQSVQLLKENLFLLNFDSTESKNKVLSEGPATFNRTPVMMQEWHERMDMSKSTISKISVWLQLPLLPLELWTPEILSQIGSVCGKPLFVDQCTLTQSRLGYARLLVEMDLWGDYPTEVKMEDDLGRSFIQKIVYESLPNRCTKCRNLGHSVSKCPMQTPTVWKAKKQPVQSTHYTGQNNQEGLTAPKQILTNKSLPSSSRAGCSQQKLDEFLLPSEMTQVEEWPVLSGGSTSTVKPTTQPPTHTSSIHANVVKDKQIHDTGTMVLTKPYKIEPVATKNSSNTGIDLGVVGGGRPKRTIKHKGYG